MAPRGKRVDEKNGDNQASESPQFGGIREARRRGFRDFE
jgi:hypothetical protein